MKISRLILLIPALIYFCGCSESGSKEADDHAILVETTLISPEDITRYHTIPSVIIAQKRSQLAFQLSGKLEEINVILGENVETGQQLARLYNPGIDPAVNANRAKLESIISQISQTEKDFVNFKELRKNNSISQTDFEHKETELKNLQAEKKSIEAQIELSEANQTETILKAPFSGVISYISKQQGEFVSAGENLISINQPDIMETEAEIPLNLWKPLNTGDTITGISEGKSVNLNVIEISQTAHPRSLLMKVILQIESNENIIGQHIDLNFPQHFNNIYQLPLNSVIDDGINKPYVFTFVGNKAKKVQINPLFINGDNIVFTTQSKIDAPVVTAGQSRISDGVFIRTE